MWVARDVALRFLATYGLRPGVSEEQIDRILPRLGVRIALIPRTIRVPEFRCGNVIGIREDVTGPARLRLKLHGLGHHQMHCGDHFRDPILLGRQERQADEFAAYLLAGEAAVAAFEIAYRLGLSADVVCQWLASLVAG